MDRIRLTGYVRIYLRSLTPERELGRIAKTGAVLRRVRRLSPTCISALCTPGDAAKISGAGLPVRIAENGGISVKLKQLFRRAGLGAAALITAAAVILLQGRVFFFRIYGINGISPDWVMAQLAQSGIVPGARASGEMLEKAEAALIRDGRVQWACVSGQGAYVTVTVKEKNEPEMPDYMTPGDLTAKKTAVIEELTVLQGTAKVRAGQLVLPGQVLISGELIYGGKPAGYVAAMGKCRARVWTSVYMQLPLEKEVTEPTGRMQRIEGVRIFGRSFGARPEFENYTAVSQSRPIMYRGLPVLSESITYYEQQKRKVRITPQELLKENEARLRCLLDERLDGITPERISFSCTEYNGGALLEICAETVEEIAVFRPAEE